MNTGDWLNAGALGVHLVSALGWLTMLGLITFASWSLRRNAVGARADSLRALRHRLLLPMWIFLGVIALTGVYNHSANTPFELPPPWNLHEAPTAYGRAYVLLLLGKQVLAAQMTLALAVLTWRLLAARPGGAVQHRGAELGASLVATLALISGAMILLTVALLGYVHVLVPGHVH